MALAPRHFLRSGHSTRRRRAIGRSLMPMRAITNISVMIFSVTDRALAIAAQLAVQSLVTFLSTLVALFEFEMGVTSLFIGAFCGQFAALGVGLVALGCRHVWSSPSRDWLGRAATNSPTTAASGIVDGTRGFGENALLIRDRKSTRLNSSH